MNKKAETTGKRPSPIVFNGVEYDSIDEMPTYARNLYEQSIRTAAPETQAADTGHRREPDGRPLEPESAFSAKTAIAAVVLVVLALVLYYLWETG